MPRFSPASLTKLQSCHIDLQTLFFEVIKTIDCIVLEGHRGEKAQNEAYQKGNSKLHWPDGKHNSFPSNAIDVAPYPLPEWKKTIDFVYFGGFVMAVSEMLKLQGKITSDIRFGGDFNRNFRISDSSLPDCVHFERII